MNILIKIEKETIVKFYNNCFFFLYGDPYGNRTHDSALRGPRLNRLTKGPIKYLSNIPFFFRLVNQNVKYFFYKFLQVATLHNCKNVV